MKNYSCKKCYNHKNDKVFFEISSNNTHFKIFVTKNYKIVKIIKNKIEIVFDLHDFIFILISGYFNINLCNKFGIKRKFRFEYNRNKFQIYHLNQLLFEISYLVANKILKITQHLLFSYIINLKCMMHIDDKKIQLNSFCKTLKFTKNKKNFCLFIKDINEQQLSNIFMNFFNFESKKFILIVLSYAFIKNMK